MIDGRFLPIKDDIKKCWLIEQDENCIFSGFLTFIFGLVVSLVAFNLETTEISLFSVFLSWMLSHRFYEDACLHNLLNNYGILKIFHGYFMDENFAIFWKLKIQFHCQFGFSKLKSTSSFGRIHLLLFQRLSVLSHIKLDLNILVLIYGLS